MCVGISSVSERSSGVSVRVGVGVRVGVRVGVSASVSVSVSRRGVVVSEGEGEGECECEFEWKCDSTWLSDAVSPDIATHPGAVPPPSSGGLGKYFSPFSLPATKMNTVPPRALRPNCAGSENAAVSI